ncbi:hypothetical protein BB778_26960 [Pluralibacter gergoviae]|nr:hypothetical protein BB778_26960 [Pluralibacter gergoviae]
MALYGLFHCGFICRFTDKLTVTGIKLKSGFPWIPWMLNNDSIIIQVINAPIAFFLNFTT